jgi:hypothetical protein
MRRNRFLFAIAAATLAAVIIPALALAQVLELGEQPKSPIVAPTCPASVQPAQCTIILTRDTALATIRDGVTLPTEVHKSGRIVAYTVGLSNLSSNTSTRKKDIDYLDTTYGGDPQVELTVLKHLGRRGQRFKVVANSPVWHVVQNLGSVAQIPLVSSILVEPGEFIALTTPTWAPVLSIDQTSSQFAYRQARGYKPNCSRPSTSNDAQKVGQEANYPCKYAGTEIQYAATEVTYPPATNAVH